MTDDDAAAVWLDPRELIPWADNPRDNDHVVDDVVDSIQRFGFGSALLARRANKRIIAGHTRHKAALKLELARVPVRLLDVSESEANLMALADNRLSEKARWVLPGLHSLLSSYPMPDIELAGWSSEDLARMAQELAPDFSPTDEGEQGELDKLAPQFVTCPECGHEWDIKKKS